MKLPLYFGSTFRKSCFSLLCAGILLAPLSLNAQTRAIVNVFHDNRDCEVSVQISGVFTVDPNDLGKEGAVFVFARLLPTNPIAPDTFWYQDSGQNWHLFSDCRVASAAFTGQLGTNLLIPIIATPVETSWLQGSELYIGYGLGGLNQPAGMACNDMLFRKNWVNVYNVPPLEAR